MRTSISVARRHDTRVGTYAKVSTAQPVECRRVRVPGSSALVQPLAGGRGQDATPPLFHSQMEVPTADPGSRLESTKYLLANTRFPPRRGKWSAHSRRRVDVLQAEHQAVPSYSIVVPLFRRLGISAHMILLSESRMAPKPSPCFANTTRLGRINHTIGRRHIFREPQ